MTPRRISSEPVHRFLNDNRHASDSVIEAPAPFLTTTGKPALDRLLDSLSCQPVATGLPAFTQAPAKRCLNSLRHSLRTRARSLGQEHGATLAPGNIRDARRTGVWWHTVWI